jgi:hypothetical protein
MLFNAVRIGLEFSKLYGAKIIKHNFRKRDEKKIYRFDIFSDLKPSLRSLSVCRTPFRFLTYV